MHPVAAVRAFDMAIAAEPDFANYAGRAQAKFNAGDFDGAEADANKSVSYSPNRIAYTILGDVAYARTKTFDKAKAYWWQAYNSGPPDDGLVRRLTAAGVAIPQTPAVQSVPDPAVKSP
jgi:tetratricopeptide (TPR) repeat protein